MYYKIVSAGQIVDAQIDPACVYYADRIGVLRCGKKDTPQGIISSDGVHIWQVEGWPELPESDGVVRMTEIEVDEYNQLRAAIDEGRELEPEPEPEPEPEDPDTLEYIREVKIKSMSAACNAAIEEGFDLQLSDGEVCHFSLTLTDQLKIQALAMKAEKGQSPLPWHADNDWCKYYPAEDIMAMYAEMEILETFHTTYFNSLKQYIKSLTTSEEINAVTYGQDIPEEYQSEVLRNLLKQCELPF